MIQQQYYTRARGGVFLNSDGYDTVSISAGLDKNFVKKTIHSFCTYDPPAALARSREKDTAMYPEIITFFQPETGELVLGKSVYVPADFTGQRSTYFVHNYVVPRNEKDLFLKKPEKLFRAKGFQTTYSAEYPRELEELVDIPFDQGNAIAERDNLFETLGLSEQIFKELLFSVFSAVTGKKKVFINLGVEIKEYANYGMRLLELISRYLPYPVRRKLGATTYSNEAESRKYIHVSFVEPAVLNSHRPELDKQYLFDLAAGKSTGVNIAGQTHEYLELAWAYLKSGREMDPFFTFCEKALSGLGLQEELEMGNYYSLATIFYYLTTGNIHFYQRNRLGMLNGILHFLSEESQSKRELLTSFPKLITIEGQAEEPDSAPHFLRYAIQFYRIAPSTAVRDFVARTMSVHLGMPTIKGLWAIVEEDVEFLRYLLGYFYEQKDERIIESYLEEKFGAIKGHQDILNQLLRILGLAPFLANSSALAGILLDKLEMAMKVSAKPFDVVIETVETLEDLKPAGRYTTLKDYIAGNLWKTLLEDLEIKTVSLEKIDKFTALSEMLPQFYKSEIDNGLSEKVTIMEALSALFKLSINKFSSLGYREQRLAREAVRTILSRDIKKDYFPYLEHAFEKEGDPQFREIVKFINEKHNADVMNEFIHWGVSYYRGNENLLQALKWYLLQEDNPIWENKDYRARLKNIKQTKVKNVIREIEYEKANAVGKIFKKISSKLR
ncbi:GAP1-N2 domain-containing protein [Bacillus sp. EB01]|uniref:GAP1-N2 domain-containing protein n=1 Tax=Bacillus sp. EB01 TaxID=1347086 RepID=UPI0005C5F5F9|nr:hypothetical protein [Bacillus sp. EB01]